MMVDGNWIVKDKGQLLSRKQIGNYRWGEWYYVPICHDPIQSKRERWLSQHDPAAPPKQTYTNISIRLQDMEVYFDSWHLIFHLLLAIFHVMVWSPPASYSRQVKDFIPTTSWNDSMGISKRWQGPPFNSGANTVRPSGFLVVVLQEGFIPPPRRVSALLLSSGLGTRSSFRTGDGGNTPQLL